MLSLDQYGEVQKALGRIEQKVDGVKERLEEHLNNLHSVPASNGRKKVVLQVGVPAASVGGIIVLLLDRILVMFK